MPARIAMRRAIDTTNRQPTLRHRMHSTYAGRVAPPQGTGNRLPPGAVAALALLFGGIDAAQQWRAASARPDR
jgi:hypothetical protein